MDHQPVSELDPVLAPQKPAPLHLLLFFTAYLGGAGAAQLLAIIPGTGISVWPPSGLFIATLIAAPVRNWPWWIAAGFAAEMTANGLWFNNPWPVAILINLGNAAEAMVAARLVQAFCRKPLKLDQVREVLIFALLCAGLAPMVSATVGSATLAAFSMQPFLSAWPLFWIGDATGVLVFAPLVFVLLQEWRDADHLSPSRLIEAGALIVIFVGIGALALSGRLPFAYLTMPPLLWAAIRFHFAGAALMLALLAALAAAFTVSGVNQFAGDPGTQAQKHVLMQLFLAVSALSALLVAALARQHQHALAALRTANSELETRVAERTATLRDSEQRFAAVLGALPLGVALVDANGRPTVANDMYKAYIPDLVPSLDPVRLPLWHGFDEKKQRLPPEAFPAARALRGERVWPGADFIYHGNPGQPVWMRVAALPFHDSAGAVCGATVVVAHIDQEKRARDALRESEERLRLAAEIAGFGVHDYVVAERAAIWSDQLYAMCGVARSQRPDRALMADIVHPDDRPRIARAMKSALDPSGDGIFDEEFRIVRADNGETRWIRNRSQTYFSGEGAARRAMRNTGIVIDVTQQKIHEQQTQLLMREVNHRAKNMLSLVQAIARQTASHSPQDFLVRFEQRLQALAASQDLLVHSGWRGAPLNELVQSQLAHFADLIGKRIILKGPPLIINAAAAQTLGLALHELATNAGKYGALSNDAGTVRIDWALQAGRFRFGWSESGGPPVTAPTRKGFGTVVVERMSRLSLDADVRFTLAGEGLTWQLDCTATQVLENVDAVGAGGGIAAPAATAAGVLVVEDEPLVGLAIAEEVERAGYTVIGPAGTVRQALELLQVSPCACAVLDINLGAETSEPVAIRLKDMGVPFITLSGYAPAQQPDIFRDATFLPKPLDSARFLMALHGLMPQATPSHPA